MGTRREAVTGFLGVPGRGTVCADSQQQVLRERAGEAVSSDTFTVNSHLANLSCQPRAVGTAPVLKHQEVWGLVHHTASAG